QAVDLAWFVGIGFILGFGLADHPRDIGFVGNAFVSVQQIALAIGVTDAVAEAAAAFVIALGHGLVGSQIFHLALQIHVLGTDQRRGVGGFGGHGPYARPQGVRQAALGGDGLVDVLEGDELVEVGLAVGGVAVGAVQDRADPKHGI